MPITPLHATQTDRDDGLILTNSNTATAPQDMPIASVLTDADRYRHCELADWSHLVEFKIDDRLAARPNLLHKIWFRELTGKDFFEMANADSSAIDKTVFTISRLTTRYAGNFPDLGEVNPAAPTEYDVKAILNRVPAWQVTTISKVVATFLDSDSE